MAWRPSEYLIEGELDNTTPDRVIGWMQFAGMAEKVTFDLKGNFHRDIRGATIRFQGDGRPDDPKAADYLDGLPRHQTGNVGDITAGRKPRDYVNYPYIEWYSDENGRVVIELEPGQVEVIGQPIPAMESDPISRKEQAQHMAKFLGGICRAVGAPAIAPSQRLMSDPSFTHWVIEQGHIMGEAREVQQEKNGACFAYVRLFGAPESAEYGTIEHGHLRDKNDPA